MRAPRTILPILLAVALLSGCGENDEAEVRDTLNAFADATARKDYQRLCDDVLAPDLVAEIRRNLPCEVALRTGFEDVREPRIEIRSIKVDGDSATARVHSTAANQEPSEDTVKLVKVDDGWRIASLAT